MGVALVTAERLRVDGTPATLDELTRRGPLRYGLDRQSALDILLALTSPQFAMFLIRERSWTLEAWAKWPRQLVS